MKVIADPAGSTLPDNTKFKETSCADTPENDCDTGVNDIEDRSMEGSSTLHHARAGPGPSSALPISVRPNEGFTNAGTEDKICGVGASMGITLTITDALALRILATSATNKVIEKLLFPKSSPGGR